MLPAEVPLSDAVRNASSLAWLTESIRDGDIDLLGRMIMRDVIVEPVRAALIPCYNVIKAAALEAGAPGCALSGSGPAIFAVSGSAEQAERVTHAMDRACRGSGFGCLSLTSTVDLTGARVE
jgi:homoserine kinase